MPVVTIITSIMTDLFRFLSQSQACFTKNPSSSIIYGIATMIIQTGNILKECIEKEEPSIFNKTTKKHYENINLVLIISDLSKDISLQRTVLEAAIKVINASLVLQKIIENEDNTLLKNGGDVFYEGDEMTFVLLREGKRVYYSFPGQLIQILKTDSVEKCYYLKLEGQPNEDGFTYYLQALPYIWDPKITAVQLTKEEARFLTMRIDQVNDIKNGIDSV